MKLTQPLNHTPDTSFAIWRGAAVPLVVRNFNRLDGVYEAFAASLALRVKVRNVASFTLAVGSGITLSSWNGVANALATCLLSEAQSLLIPSGRFASYELTEGAPGSLSIVMAGSLVGEGPA